MCNRLDCTTCCVVPTVGYVQSYELTVLLIKVDQRTRENAIHALGTIHFGAAFLTVASTASWSSFVNFSTPLLVKILQLLALALTFLVLFCQHAHRSYCQRRFLLLGAQAVCSTPLAGTGFWQRHGLFQVPNRLIVRICPRAIYAHGRARRRMHAPLAQPPACACSCACWCSQIFPYKNTETIAWQLAHDMRAYAHKETANTPGVPLLRFEGSLHPAHQSVTNVSEQLWRWYDQSALMCRKALPAQIKAYKACECGRQPKMPHVFSEYESVQTHAAHAQACAQPAHRCAAAACHRASAQIRHASASAAPICVAPGPPACHRAPAQALTSEHALFQYRGYKPYQLKLHWPVRSDDSAWRHVLTFFHEDKDLDTYTYAWWLRFHILWETAWESAGHRGHSVDVKRLEEAIVNEEIPGGTVGSVLRRCDEFEIVDPDWSLNNIVKHEDFIIFFGMQVYAEEQSGVKDYDGINPWTHLFYVLLLSCKNRLGREELRQIHIKNIEDDISPEFRQRVATGMQRLAADAERRAHVDVSDLWRLLQPDAPVHANPNPHAHNP